MEGRRPAINIHLSKDLDNAIIAMLKDMFFDGCSPTNFPFDLPNIADVMVDGILSIDQGDDECIIVDKGKLPSVLGSPKFWLLLFHCRVIFKILTKDELNDSMFICASNPLDGHIYLRKKTDSFQGLSPVEPPQTSS